MLETIQTKICTKCKVEKEISLFSNDKSKSCGKHPVCKECKSAYHSVYRYENKQQLSINKKIYSDSHKEDKRIYDHARNQLNRDDISLKCKLYYLQNKINILNQMKMYRINNKEKLSNKSKERYIANKHTYAIKNNEYYINNKDKVLSCNKKWRDNNRQSVIDYRKEYLKSSHGKTCRRNSEYKRRSITKQGDVTTNQLLSLEHSAKKCYWCHKLLQNNNIHRDHYYPLSKGGSHTISNLVISCKTCNLMKHAKDPIEFANSLGRLL